MSDAGYAADSALHPGVAPLSIGKLFLNNAMSDSKPSEVSHSIEALKAAQNHHVSMTAMADQKASLLLGASLIALAVVLSRVGHSAVHYSRYALALTALGTALFATLALMPRMLVLRDSKSNREVNLLFCGHFSSLNEEEYVERMRQTIGTPGGAVEALTRDLFQMGLLVHQKKFRFLGYAYTFLLLGLLVTGAAAGVDFFLR